METLQRTGERRRVPSRDREEKRVLRQVGFPAKPAGGEASSSEGCTDPHATTEQGSGRPRSNHAGVSRRSPSRGRLRSAAEELATDERGAVTAEYALVIMAAVAFAGLLIVIMRSEEVRAMLLSLVQGALGSAG